MKKVFFLVLFSLSAFFNNLFAQNFSHVEQQIEDQLIEGSLVVVDSLERDYLSEVPGLLYPHIWFNDSKDYILKLLVDNNIFKCDVVYNKIAETYSLRYCANKTSEVKFNSLQKNQSFVF